MEPQNHEPAPRKKINTAQWIAVIVIVAALFYMAQKMGCGPVKTEEKMEWIDR